tara:strand:- start:2471 stop:3661 length:1191 start_codon:yes stop_codon:yes gene_type:complete
MMKKFPANSPKWLTKKIYEKGGKLTFYEYMNIVLNDPTNGYYGSGKAKVGINGDFVTSPSLSDDFSYFIAIQIEEWLEQIKNGLSFNGKFTIIEFGSGKGCLINGIIDYFFNKDKQILEEIAFKIIDLNEGMIIKQKENLEEFLNYGIDISWIELEDLKDKSINGIIIANEVLDAFPVERIHYSRGHLYQQCVSFNEKTGELFLSKNNLNENLKLRINYLKNNFGINIPPEKSCEGWSSELHINQSEWLQKIYKKLHFGILLIIDYAIDSKKYYSSNKNDGTIIAYKNQKAIDDFLFSPGNCDLTCHICSDILIRKAKEIGFGFNGMVKQGEALLLLGLAEKLYSIQKSYNNDISKALLKREALLRLVDPLCLGNFKWFIFDVADSDFKFKSKCIN